MDDQAFRIPLRKINYVEGGTKSRKLGGYYILSISNLSELEFAFVVRDSFIDLRSGSIL